MSPFLSSLLQMMKHAWDGYAAYAWGKNELRPVTKRGHSASIFGSAAMGASIIDGMVRSIQGSTIRPFPGCENALG